MLAKSQILLLELTAATTVQTGAAKTVRDAQYDGVDAHEQTFLGVFELTATGGTSPTVDATLQTSFDGTTWHTIASMTQLSGAGTQTEIKPISYLGPYNRAVVTPGGTAAPSVSGAVRLASSGTLTS